MLFDMNDYLISGLIGPSQTPVTTEDFVLCKQTFEATLNAQDKTITDFINLFTPLDTTCTEEVNTLIAEYSTNYDALVIAGDIFWDSMISFTSTKTIQSTYYSAIGTYMYTIRKLLNVVDGDTFKIV